MVARQFSHLFNAYAKAFNKQYDRQGSLFRGDVQRKLVPQESYYTKLIHYIHYNPVHHGFVRQPEEWKHSSFHSLISARPTLQQRQEVMDWFGGTDAYIRFHRQRPDDRLLTKLEF
ncbi:hypothetical protein [Botryobacter ruber]|uniref:hypothetical protein n=1 Tax=Botryobacter ruber TaxID=2171629 RepID=UPI000F64AC45|nr:hypothetical protein [Botryobacter ruber]